MKIFTRNGLIFTLLLFGSVISNAQDLVQSFIESNDNGGNSGLGLYVDIVGDVNNDGYDDIAMTGRDSYYPTSRVFIYFGGAEFDDIPDLVLEVDPADASFGDAVSGAGDINKDGYDDIIVGSHEHNANTGRAYVFYGGADMDNVADLVLSGEGTDNYFGHEVSRAGDINNDGYSDFIVGAYGYNSYTGRVYIYYGGATVDGIPDVILNGENTGDKFGAVMSEAGDINNDEYDDILVSSYGFNSNTGRVYVYHGGASMDNVPELQLTGKSENGQFGVSISEIGDANNDGFDDFVVGGRSYYSDRRTFLYYGGTNMDNHWDNYLVEDRALSGYDKRILVTGAGDVNKDGYDDVLSFYYSYQHDKIRMYIHFGREKLYNYPDRMVTVDSFYDGFCLTTRGDVNGDGYDDILLGHGSYDGYNGRALIYYGSEGMDFDADVEIRGEGKENSFAKAVSAAGDVNNDGFEDVLVGAPEYSNKTGRSYIYYGGVNMDFTPDVILTGRDGENTNFGSSIAAVGDVNNDGYDDVMIGASGYDVNRGRTYIYYGGSDMDNEPDVIMTGEAINNYFGFSHSGAGDVNKDGYDDVVIGAYGYNSRGRVYIFHGGFAMDNIPDLTMSSDILNKEYGMAVSNAGDVNKDGYGDIVIGTNSDTEIHFGGATMDHVRDVYIEEGRATDVGKSISCAGDVNKDGYDDIIVGDYIVNSEDGAAYIYFGGAAMDNLPDVTINMGGVYDHIGKSVSGGGDINNDGFDDVIIGAPIDMLDHGKSFIFYGGSDMDNAFDVKVLREVTRTNFGSAVSIVGDINNDGYDEFMIGAYEVEYNGKAYLYSMSPLPAVNTISVTNVTDINATAKGTILKLGETQPTVHGFCWSTDPTPTISNHKLDKGATAATGEFTGDITGLTGGTTYYIRAFSTNDSGTSYGEELNFKTLKSDQTISFNALNAVTYGDASFLLTASASSGLAVSYTSSDPDVATVTGNSVSIVGAGTTTITAIQEGNSSHNAASQVQQVLSVNKASLTITADDKTKIYGAVNPALSISYSGFVNGEDATALTSQPLATTSADASSGVGSVPITLSGAAADNYSFNYVNGALSINKAELTVTADDKSKIYGDANPAFTFRYMGFVNGENPIVIDTEPSAISIADASTGVGSADITLSGGIDDNYSFSYVNGTLSIGKAELTVTADDKSKTYGEHNPNLTISYAGFVNGDDESDLTSKPMANSTADENTGAGSVPITLSGGSADHYSFKYYNGSLTINKANLTVTADDKSKTYGDANPAFTVSYSGFVNSDDASDLTKVPTAFSTASETSGAGSAIITVSGGEDENYNFNYVNGTLDINKTVLTVSADDKTKTYGESNPAFTISYAGFVNGEDVPALTNEPSASSTADENTNAGVSDITVSGGIADNYSFNYVKGGLTINKVELCVIADDKSKTYGEANPLFTLSYAGFVSGEDATDLATAPTASSVATETTNAGSIPVSVSGGVSANYTFKYTDGSLTINKAELTVTAEDKIKIYGEANPAFTISYSDFVNGENESVLATAPTAFSTASETTGAGSAHITVSGGVDENYSFKYVNGSLDINKAVLTVIADDKTKTYGESNPVFTIRYSGFVNGEDANALTTEPTAGSIADENTSAGSSDITVSGGIADNYNFKYVKGTLSINKAELIVKADDKSKTYGEVNPELTVSYTGFVNGDNPNSLTKEATPATVVDANTEPGSATINVSGAQSDNYTFTYQNGTLSINKAELTVTADDKVKLYGEVNPEFTFKYSGFVNGDDALALTSQPIAGSTADVSTGTGATSVVVSGGESDLYNFKYQNGTLSINKTILNVNTDDITRNYGENNPAFNLKYIGFVNGDDVSALSQEPHATCAANSTTEVSGVEIIISGGAADNYKFEYEKAMLLINPAELYVSVDNKTRAYGEANPEFTLSYTGFVNGDEELVLDTKPTCTTEANQQTGIGDFDIIVSGGSDSNYNFNYIKGTLTINRAELTVSADDKAITYGDDIPEFTLSYAGFVNEESALVLTSQPVLASNADENFNAGTEVIIVSGGAADNYSLKHVNGTLSINKAELTVSADDKNKKYGAENPDFSLSYNGFVKGEDASVLTTEPTVSSNADETTDAGTEEITVSGGAADNYSFKYMPGSLSIGKANLTVTADNLSREQGKENPELTLSFSGFLNGDDESEIDVLPVATCEADENSTPGDYDITIDSGEDNNYDFDYVKGVLSVTLVTGIADLELAELVAYPNPSKDWLAIKWTGNRTCKAEIQILSMNGSLVKTIQDYSEGSKINISELRPGTYMVRIKIEDTYEVKKIIKV